MPPLPGWGLGEHQLPARHDEYQREGLSKRFCLEPSAPRLGANEPAENRGAQPDWKLGGESVHARGASGDDPKPRGDR